jgi:hypothetical protein
MRTKILAGVVVVACWFMFLQDSTASAMGQRFDDLFESRPIRTVLIVGNSRTFFNGMPGMLHGLSESPESSVVLEVENSTSPGASFESHSRNGRTIRLLRKGWDEVLLQAESASQASIQQSESFHTYGIQLAQMAKVHEGRPALLVNWPYDPSLFKGDEGYERSEHLAFLRSVNARLAADAKLERVNLAGVWESVRLANPELKLTSDGNHPTVAGSYLYALAAYKHVTGASVASLSYVPGGLDPETARMLRDTVDAFPIDM